MTIKKLRKNVINDYFKRILKNGAPKHAAIPILGKPLRATARFDKKSGILKKDVYPKEISFLSRGNKFKLTSNADLLEHVLIHLFNNFFLQKTVTYLSQNIDICLLSFIDTSNYRYFTSKIMLHLVT